MCFFLARLGLNILFRITACITSTTSCFDLKLRACLSLARLAMLGLDALDRVKVFLKFIGLL